MFRAVLVPSAVAVLFVPELFAQGTPPLAPGPTEIAPVEVRGERTATVVGGAAVLVVRPDSSRAGVALTLAEMMRAVPQVLVRTNSRGEAELSVRGSDSRQVSLMMNGLPLSPSWDGRADPSLVPLSGISEISFVRSTGSLLGGPNAIGGVMDLRVGAPVGTTRSAALGTDETGARLASLSLGTGLGALAGGRAYVRAGAGYRSRDGQIRAHSVPDFDADGRLRTNTDLRHGDAFVAAGWDGARGAAVSALLSGYTAERGVAPELHVASPRRWRYPDQARALVQVQASAPALVSRLGTTTVSGSVGALDARVRIEQFSDLTFTTVSGTEAGDERVTSGRVALTHITPRGAEWLSALTINDVRYDETLNADPTSRYRQRLASAGLERQWNAGPDNLLTMGVVLDHAATLESGGKAANPDRSSLGWRLGATRTVSATTRTHASVSSRARFPALRELYSGALNRFEPNPGLRPEHLLAAEAGATWARAAGVRGVRAQAVVFHHWLDDAVVRVPFDTTNRFIRINRDELRSFGLETSLGWRGASQSSVDVDFVLQRVRIRDAAAGASARRPEHMPGVRAMISGARGVGRGIVVGANLAHIGSQYCVDPGGAGNLSLGAQQVAGVTAERSWTVRGAFSRIRLLVGADNLTDAAVYEQCGLPRAGRTLRAGLSLH